MNFGDFQNISDQLIEIRTLPILTMVTFTAGRDNLDKMPCLMLSARMSTSEREYRWSHFRTRTVT